MVSHSANRGDDLNLPKLKKDIHLAFKQWHDVGIETSPLHYLWLFQKHLRNEQGRVHAATNALLFELLQKLPAPYLDAQKVLIGHFLDDKMMYEVANDLGVHESNAHLKQKRGIEQLAEMMLAQETKERKEHISKQEKRLETPIYTHFVVDDDRLKNLEELLMPDRSPWMVAITGIGGIGKTTLSDVVVRGLMGIWEEIGWVTAKPVLLNLMGDIEAISHAALTVDAIMRALLNQLFAEEPKPMPSSVEEAVLLIEQRLRKRATLIVIDNLEAVEDLRSLMPILRRLANPSKFLLTSRESLYEEPLIYHLPVPELSEVASLQLIRHAAEESNLSNIAEASDEDLRAIYTTVGGNPLALKLIIGQLHTHALNELLTDLRNVQGSSAENLYSYIYRHAWNKLSESERIAWLAMPMLSPQGSSFDFIAAMVRDQLVGADLRRILTKLVKLNLIDCRRNGLNDVQYSIHGLTRTFLDSAYRW